MSNIAVHLWRRILKLEAQAEDARRDAQNVRNALYAASIACDEWEQKNGDAPHRVVDLATRIRVNAGLVVAASVAREDK